MKQAKKILALILSALMLLSVMSIGISANTDAPIVIDQESDWEKYKQTDGSYLLPEDGKFTVSAQLQTLSGNFNGNGSTITTSVPLFYNVAGVTVENLTIEGEISCSDNDSCGVLTDYVTSTSIIKNVTSNANLTVTGLTGPASEGQGVGSIVGCAARNSKITIIDCTNNGTVTVTGTYAYAGGIIGKVRDAVSVTENCVNNNTVTVNAATADTVLAGGILGYVYGASTVTVDDCVNNAAVNAQYIAGGVVGFVNNGVATITNCGNTCNVTSETISGGIIGRNYGKPNVITYCYNTGEVKTTGTGYAGGIDATGDGSILNYCWNSGNVIGQTCTAQIVGNAAMKTEFVGNYYLSTLDAKAIQFSGSEATNEGATAFTADDLASGKLAYDINKAAGTQVFFQNVNSIQGEANDAHPVFDSTHGHVFKTGDATYGSLRFYTLTTASVRISANENERGIRFSTAVNKKDFDALNVKADFGTLITPNDYLAAANNDFTALAEDNYLDVNSTATGADNFLTLRGADNDTYYYFCGSITGIKAANYDWDYSAVGYVIINGETVYSTQYATRNIKFVAGEAVKDATSYTEQELEYINTYLQ